MAGGVSSWWKFTIPTSCFLRDLASVWRKVYGPVQKSTGMLPHVTIVYLQLSFMWLLGFVNIVCMILFYEFCRRKSPPLNHHFGRKIFWKLVPTCSNQFEANLILSSPDRDFGWCLHSRKNPIQSPHLVTVSSFNLLMVISFPFFRSHWDSYPVVFQNPPNTYWGSVWRG